jgi:dihydroflavonol-4-reductase
MKRIFVTGATGLLGSVICRKLIKDGHQITAIKRATSKLDLLGDLAAKINWIEGDVRDIESLDEGMKNSEYLIHCAAMISFVPEDAEAMMQINVEGTANVMNSALINNIKRVLHVSSVAAFGRPKGVAIIDEELDIKESKDNFHYYRSKFLGEREALRAHAEGLNLAIINPSTILGGGYWDMEPNKLFAQIHNGYYFYTEGCNGFVDVRDVAEVAIKVLFSDLSGEKFIVSAENISFKDLIWKIADEFKVKRPFLAANKYLGEIAWRLDTLKGKLTGKRPLVTKEVIEIALCEYRYNNEKVKKNFNFEFRKVDDTIKDVCELYKESRRLNQHFAIIEI